MKEMVSEEKVLTTKKAPGAEKKTLAKAAGLKSALILNADTNEVLMTSYGKGNEANLEKRIHKGVVADINKGNKQFDIVQDKGPNFLLNSSRNSTVGAEDAARPNTADPTRSRNQAFQYTPGMDQLRRKPELERRYFGKEFSDNIHIQMIYNVLDINKILAVYSSSIIYIFNNILRTDHDDFFAAMNTERLFVEWEKNKDKKNNANFFNAIKQPQMAYFGEAFYDINPAKERDDKDYCIKKPDAEIYSIMAMLGAARQFCVHGTVTHQKKESHSWLYNLSDIDTEFLSTLDKTYSQAINRVNRNFAKTNKVNLNILADALGIDSRNYDILIREYYNFVVLKAQKNLGFSIKKLRESILLLPKMQVVKGKSYDSVRHKLYSILDFILYYYYTQCEPNRLDDLVAELRALPVGGESEEKDSIYSAEASRIWPECEEMVTEIVLPALEGKSIRNLQRFGIMFSEAALSSVKIDQLGSTSNQSVAEKNADYFCKLIYLMTLFLDGKEINDLLTTLINKFDNIASFYHVLDNLKISNQFTAEYAMFSQCTRISQTLRCINSFARMQKPTPNANQCMFREAIQLLGTDMNEAQIQASVIDIFGIDPSNGKKKENAKHDIRNFISNNVIESDRFRYLIRYADPAKVKALAKNENLIHFVLSRIPLSQIDRYCVSCGRPDLPNRAEKERYLTKLISDLNYQQFVGVNNDDRKSSWQEKDQKKKFQAIISLYLTILFLAVKNLVYVNSRYVMAFHCLERDFYLYGSELSGVVGDEETVDAAVKASVLKDKEQQYLVLTKLFAEKCYLKKRPREYIQQDMSHISDTMLRHFRNSVAHLEAVRKASQYIPEMGAIHSYYELYQYLMQRRMMEDGAEKQWIEVTPSVEKYFNDITAYRSYSKDFAKALCTPFGYNLARFKNLSIEELFDRNREEKSE